MNDFLENHTSCLYRFTLLSFSYDNFFGTTNQEIEE